MTVATVAAGLRLRTTGEAGGGRTAAREGQDLTP